MKKALVHEWYEVAAGSEKCVESFTNIWGDFDHFALVDFLNDADRDRILKGEKAKTSFIQNLPFAKTSFRNYLPLFPFAVEQFDLSDYDFIMTNSHAVAKGVITRVNQLHICYCHSPMRYAWDLYHQYIKQADLRTGLKGLIAKYTLHRLRIWDFTTANRPDFFIANSGYTAARIKKIYNREAEVIYPPVDTHKFPLETRKDDFYLTASRLVPYKRIDLVVEAFSRMPDKKLVVVGDGPDLDKIKHLATANISILGYQEFDKLRSLMQRAKAFVFAAEEDFGIVVIEAMSCGTPVIGLGKGGTKETIKPGLSGIHFQEQTSQSIIDAVRQFEKQINSFNSNDINHYAQQFSKDAFEEKIMAFVESKAAEKLQ
ncbi:MAG: glycosyltransferase [Ignavibacteriaceae bacterium]|nr:glycosyltransferase [Ignavibacteriaceae bacterium]